MCHSSDLVEIQLDVPAMIISDGSNNCSSQKDFFRSMKREISCAPDGGSKSQRSKITTKDTDAIADCVATSPAKVSCLRQMYCPDCEQRLNVDTINYERLFCCCLPIFPLHYIYWRAHRRNNFYKSKVTCKKCGGNLGYWKQM